MLELVVALRAATATMHWSEDSRYWSPQFEEKKKEKKKCVAIPSAQAAKARPTDTVRHRAERPEKAAFA
jgi:hypothetical protein